MYDESGRRDGYVSMEVSPYLAHDTQGDRRRGDAAVEARSHRDNLMIKVPATPEGIPAIRELIGQGINVNVTLLFSRDVCRQVAEAYMDGLEAFAAHGGRSHSHRQRRQHVRQPPGRARRPDPRSAQQFGRQPTLRGLVGKVAIANAKLAYQDWKQLCRGPRWQALAARGARVQRLLWASTSAKDPRFRDVMYVEALIGPDTVDTIPPATLDALRDHGKAHSRLDEHVEDARAVLAALAHGGISIDDLTARLLDEGVKEFSAAFDKLLASIENKRAGVLESALDRTRYRFARSARRRGAGDARGLAHNRQGAAPLGTRCVAVDRPRRESLARLAERRRSARQLRRVLH